MRNCFKKLTYLFIACILGLQVSAQSVEWQVSKFQDRLTPTNQQFDFELISKIETLQNRSAFNSISLPNPKGESIEFSLKPSTVMSPVLAAKFPSIKTYDGISKNGESMKLTISNKGVHAMVFSHDGLYFIDPIAMKSATKHQAYFKKDLDLNVEKANFEEGEPIIFDKEKFTKVQKMIAEKNFTLPPSGTELRTYRIAIAATGEYTAFHGGTVANAMAAIVVTMARVNGIYERDLAITMVLVDNNEQLVFTDANADPFTNNDAGSYLSELQAEIDDVIGNDNYDIGHGFSTGAGGRAGLGVVCLTGNKGRGVTGTNSPIGDPYDVDYVAHEIGHQFGGPHTFNGVNGSCGNNRSSSTAYEPGSGITIMAYAGICGADNTANNSIPFFHASSLASISIYSQEANGNSCATITETGNTPPTVEAGAGGFTIPINTPFQLNGSATDAEGDNLSYSWEQFDLGPAGTPNSPEGNAPLFRSFVPTTDSFRIFPNLADILNNTQTIGEILPSYARDMSFMLTVRDDQAVGGVNNDLISFSVSDVGGPFIVNEVTGDYSGLEVITVTWDVANTNLSPINCSSVNIYVSDNGGQTFSYLVEEATANDGSQNITLPNINAANAKIKVAAAQNIFFNISRGNFTISETTNPTFTLAKSFNKASYCPTDELQVEISTQSVLNYNSPIQLSVANLAAGLNATFNPATINPGESSILTIANPSGITGTIGFKVNAVSNDINKDIDLSTVVVNIPETPQITEPANGALVGIYPTISWTDDNILTTYDLEVASDDSFSTIIESVQDITEKNYTLSNSLASTTTYFVKLSAKNSCGTSEETVFSIETDQVNCNDFPYKGTDVAIPSSPATVTSTLTIGPDAGIIQLLEVLNVRGNHTYIADLTFILESPKGTQAILLSEICDAQDNFNLSFSDVSGSSQDEIPCPPTDGKTYLPSESLSVFNGEQITGDWKLTVIDSYNQDGGALTGWALNFCLTQAKLTPKRPTNLMVNYQDGLDFNLSWSGGTIEKAYEIERKSASNAEFKLLETITADTAFLSTSLDAVGNEFTYRVRAVNDNLYSEYSPEVNASIRILANKELEQSQISIFPNPAKKQLNILNKGNQAITKITITDLSGKLVNNISADSKSVDLSGYKAGLYIITFKTTDKVYATRLIIQ